MDKVVTSLDTPFGVRSSQIIEEDKVPSEIVEYLQRSAKGHMDHPERRYREKSFWVTDICKCLRQSYYDIMGMVPDFQKEDLTELWSVQSGKFLHRLTYSYGWRELPMEKEFLCEDIGEIISVCGRLDMYDHRAARIIDLKTTNAIKWQYKNRFIPRQSDILQLLCYGSMFREAVKVSQLTLIYADMKDILAFAVRLSDMNSWMKERIEELYVSLVIRKAPPPAEPSTACNYCKFKARCTDLDIINRMMEIKGILSPHSHDDNEKVNRTQVL